MGSEDRWRFNVTVAAEGVSPNVLAVSCSLTVEFQLLLGHLVEILVELYFGSNLPKKLIIYKYIYIAFYIHKHTVYISSF